MVSKIRAGVFFGGPSVEHEVSVITAMQAIRALDPDRYQVIPVYVSKQGDFYTGEHLASLESYRNIPAALEKARRVVLQKEGDRVCLVLARQKRLGSSVGIHKCRDRAALLEGLEDAFLYSQAVLAERAVPNLREINCAVLGDDEEARVSVCEEPLNATDILTYADKYQSGGKTGKTGAKSGGSKGMQSLARVVPADLPPETAAEVQRLAVLAFRAIGACGCSRVDFLMDGQTGALYVNEINTIPGSLAFYLWEQSGLSFSGLMDELVRLALKRQRQKALLHTSFDTNLLQNAQLGGAKGGKKV